MYAIHMLAAAKWTTVPESDAIVNLLRQLESHAEATQSH
jgi:hypothetical protein